MHHLILGSQSRARKEILSHYSIPFTQMTSGFDEEAHPFQGGNAGEYAKKLAIGKAKAIAENYPDAKILTADTVVYLNETVFGKPKTELEAIETLMALSGSCHSVFTGVAVLHKGAIHSGYEETKVFFNELTLDEIKHYQSKIHLFDKAGSYTVQSAGGLAVRKIDGCYYNVVGLPMNTVRRLLLEIGIELWDYLK